MPARLVAPPPLQVSVAPTLPGPTAGIVRAALAYCELDLAGVALRVKRHGVRRAFFLPCDDERCGLVHTTDPRAQISGAAAPGHLYARRLDLAACRSAGPIVGVDVTQRWVTGRAYDGVPYPRAVAPGTRNVVTVKVPPEVPDGMLPAERTYHRARTAGPTLIAEPADDLVFVLAHELHHVHQFRTGAPRSEVEAELAGRRVMQRWVADGRPGLPA